MEAGEREEIIVRRLRVDEISRLYPLADKFFSESEFLKDFNRDHFASQWAIFINGGHGVIFLAQRGGATAGALGAVKFTDPNNGRLIASELFWYVDPEHRGCGLHLLNAFEDWAREQSCGQIIMVYLADLMPAVVRKIYQQRGFREMEVHWTKEI